MRLALTTILLSALLVLVYTASGSTWPDDAAFDCRDTALCFPPNTESFDRENLAPILRRLGFTGDEQIRCDDAKGMLLCTQHQVQGIPAYGFLLKVVLWPSGNDIRRIWCECLREDVVLPKSKISDADALGAAKRFVRGHLLARPDAALKVSEPSPAIFRVRDAPDGVELTLLSRAVFETRNFVPATLDIYVNSQNGRVVRAFDIEKSIDRKPFPMKPWDDLGARLALSPTDDHLFREYQEHGAFRGRAGQRQSFRTGIAQRCADLTPKARAPTQ